MPSGNLIVADGVPVVWTSRFAACPCRSEWPGRTSRLRFWRKVPRRVSASISRRRKEVVEDLVRFLSSRPGPRLQWQGWRDGYSAAADHTTIVADRALAPPHMLFIDMPSPFKETWWTGTAKHFECRSSWGRRDLRCADRLVRRARASSRQWVWNGFGDWRWKPTQDVEAFPSYEHRVPRAGCARALSGSVRVGRPGRS